MAKIVGKGHVVEHTISCMLTPIAQIIEFELTGAGSETYKSTTLDGGVYHTYDPTGYSEPGSVNATLFYDPALAGHQFFGDTMDAPADNAMRVTHTDSGSTTQSFTVAGVQLGYNVVQDDGVRGRVSWKIDGDPGWPT